MYSQTPDKSVLLPRLVETAGEGLFLVACLCLFVCLLSTLRENCHETFLRDEQCLCDYAIKLLSKLN